MRYLSLCSGIEAASVAWRLLGWKAVGFAEIEPFPCAVLKYHFPNVPNLGDISKINGVQYNGAVDLIVAGTPCQDFSIAGKRAGMAGERSGLAREFVRLVREINPQWLVWENVPGIFSTNKGRDFGSFIGALDDSGYSCAWRVLDAQFFGVPQRRRRVFVVGYFGDWRPTAKILFESESLYRNIAPRSQKRSDIAGTIKGGSGKRGWESGAEITFIPHIKSHWAGGPHPCLNQSAKSSGGIGMSDQELFSQQGAGLVPYYSMVPFAVRTAQTSANGHGIAENVSHTLDQANGQAIAFAQNQCGEVRASRIMGTLNQNSNASGRNTPLIAYAPPIVEQAISCKWAKGSSEPAGDEHHNLVAINRSVRRLTPIECERLMGFPDGYTAIEYRGKPAPDSARYKALGNSMAVPVMRWIGERIEKYEREV